MAIPDFSSALKYPPRVVHFQDFFADRYLATRAFSFCWTCGESFSQDLGGDALANLALRVTIFQQQVIRMGMDVNEAGCHHQALGVNGQFAFPGKLGADGHDSVTPDGQICVKPGVSRAVYNAGVFDQ